MKVGVSIALEMASAVAKLAQTFTTAKRRFAREELLEVAGTGSEQRKLTEKKLTAIDL